jgi:hypothetical protein
MNEKDYHVVALLIAEARKFHTHTRADAALDTITNMLAGAFSVQSETFDIEKFRVTAGAKD